MTKRSTRSSLVVATVAAAGLVGCGGQGFDGENVGASQDMALGDALAGISASDFSEAKGNFLAGEGLTDGLGPVFNDRACGNCHANGAPGGAGENVERRYGRFVNGVFDPMEGNGGSLRQLFTVANFNNPIFHGGPSFNPTLCQVPLETEPSGATVHNVGRLTTPLFGLGLVDAMPDSFFDSIVAAEPAAVRGVVNRVPIVLPNAHDPTQSIGQIRVGRFGWKAGVPDLAQFAADAYVNEMGISTQHCSKGVSVTAFATESAPNGIPEPLGCDDLAPLQSQATASALGIPRNTDDIVGSCAGGRSELQEDVDNFTLFMTFLAPPPHDNSDPAAAVPGATVFNQIGCNGCHVTTTFRTPANPPNGVPGNFAFQPYSDFAVHDMGTLGDRIGNAGDSLAVTRRMRTAPLWGIRFRNHLLHDGRTSDIPTAIRAHDGQGAAARNAFNALSATAQHNLVEFLRSL